MFYISSDHLKIWHVLVVNMIATCEERDRRDARWELILARLVLLVLSRLACLWPVSDKLWEYLRADIVPPGAQPMLALRLFTGGFFRDWLRVLCLLRVDWGWYLALTSGIELADPDLFGLAWSAILTDFLWELWKICDCMLRCREPTVECLRQKAGAEAA